MLAEGVEITSILQKLFSMITPYDSEVVSVWIFKLFCMKPANDLQISLFQADTNRERIEQANIRAKKLIDN